MISFPAPALCQGADEDLMVEIGEVVFPGCVARAKRENGLRLWVDGTHEDQAARADAVAKFQTLLGVLRAWRPDAGELREEQRAGLGEGSIRDESGNQYLAVSPAVTYTRFGGEIESLTASAREGINASQRLRNALWLNGRQSRTAADFYMILEYARMEFGGKNGIDDVLGVSATSQGRLTQAANNLSPLEGGRHAKESAVPGMILDEQRSYIADLLRRWIRLY